MKNWIIGLMAFGISFSASAGNFIANVDAFKEIRVLGNYKVFIEKGEEQKVDIRNNAPEVIDEKIICEVKDSILTIRIKGDSYKERAIEIYITYKVLNQITAKSGCIVEVKNKIVQDNFSFLSESGGKIKASVECKKVSAGISTGGSIHLDGSVSEAEYKVNAGGTIGVVSLQAKKVYAQIVAGGEIICSVEDDLSIKITSGGNVSYVGSPEVYEQNITLGGKISKIKSPVQ